MKKSKKNKTSKYKLKRYNYDLSFCPHCYSKMDRNSGVCKKCGFRESSLNEATNTLAKKAKQNFREDEVVLTKKLPKDVSYKMLILLVFLTGFVGGHLYYVGRYKKAVLYSIMFVVGIFSFTMFMVFDYISNTTLSLLLTFCDVATAVYFIDLICEWCRVVFKRFKVPVLAPEKIEDYDRSKLELKEEK